VISVAINALLVEDNPLDARLIREYLSEARGAPFSLECVDNLSGALEQLAQERPDVLLLDLGLPESQGLDTLSRVLARAPQTPVVVLTGLDDQQLAYRAVAEGAQDYLVKGRVDGELLVRSMRYAIERRRTQEALRQYSEKLEQMVRQRTRDLEEAQGELIRKEKLALLGELASSLAHELRHPLGVISNSAYYLRAVLPEAGERVRKHLGIIGSEVRVAEGIISSLLAYAELADPHRVEVSLCEEVTRVLSAHPAPEGIEVGNAVSTDLPHVLADSSQVRHALACLFVNAYQAMADGGRLTLMASQSPDRVEVSITDTGPGIPEANLDKIFEPLFSTKARGVGLGLSVCRSLIEANGGTVSVQTVLGKGSTFTVALPLAQRAQKDQGPEMNDSGKDGTAIQREAG
jgi:signal transduction histidine kinase